MAQPLTEVRLLSVPLENDYIHTYYFSSASAQEEFMKERTIKTYTNLTYQRKENSIRIPAQLDTLLTCNYVMYKNANYSNKWFYAFITDFKYINDERTDIEIETDVLQTWHWNYSVKASFVEREHVKDDTIGAHTVPEKLELGDYICNLHTKAGYCKSSDLVIVVGTTKTPEGDNVRGSLYDNIYSGVKYYTFANTHEGAEQLESWLKNFAGDGAVESITCMFLAPEKLSGNRENHTIATSNTIDTYFINNSTVESDGLINSLIAMTNNDLEGYYPDNNKLLTYPYRYLLASNNAGGSALYKFEQFYTVSNNGVKTFNPPTFKIEGCLTPGCSVRLIPEDYNGIEQNDEEALNLGKFPALNWTSDVYTNWLTQNGVNVAISTVGSVASIVGGIALATTGAGAMAGAGAIGGGILGIANTLGEVYQHSLTPPQAEGNLNAGDVVTASGKNDFHFYDMSIKKEYAQIIDAYFNAYGYKVNQIKVPNRNHRESYWFTKTIDVNIDGQVPGNDLKKIKECYNKGFTFWKNHYNIGNYNVSNKIV